MIVITGASEGLGHAIAKVYKEAGKKVVNISRRECEYADVNVCLSLREGPEIKKAADAVNELDDTLEAIIHNAGVNSGQPLGEIEEDEIKRLMSTNVKSQVLLTSNLIERIKQDQTDIVCVASAHALGGRGDIPVYTASKWAVRGFAKSLQDEFRSLPNRIVSFLPGQMNTAIHTNNGAELPKDVDDRMDVDAMAGFVKNILDLPKNMQVSEVSIERKVSR